jgi:hypothetical protein
MEKLINITTGFKNEEMIKALNDIKSGWLAGSMSAGITLIITLLVISGINILSFNASYLIDVVLIAGLSYGVYKKSRVCAVLLFILFIIVKIMIILETGKFVGWPVAVILAYYLFRGILGTFKYHKLLKSI